MKAIFAICQLLIFFKIASFFCFFVKKIEFFMIKLEIFRVLLHPSSCGAVDNVSGHHAVGHAFESRSEPLFLLKYLLIGGGTFVPPCPNGVDFAYVQTGNINL